MASAPQLRIRTPKVDDEGHVDVMPGRIWLLKKKLGTVCGVIAFCGGMGLIVTGSPLLGLGCLIGTVLFECQCPDRSSAESPVEQSAV